MSALERLLSHPDPLRFSSYGLARSAAEELQAAGHRPSIDFRPRDRNDAYPYLITLHKEEAE